MPELILFLAGLQLVGMLAAALLQWLTLLA
jgi:hypothetical protein